MTDITDPRDVRYTDCWPLKPGRFNLVGQRKPKWLIAAIDAEEQAWALYDQMIDLHSQANTPATREALDLAHAEWFTAQRLLAEARHEFHQHPEVAFDSEDAQDTREAGSAGYQGVE